MSGCPPDALPPDEFDGQPVLVPPPPGGTKLITLSNAEPSKLTTRRDCDAVTALKRGLAEYLAQVFLDVDGQRVQFQNSLYAWAEPEDGYALPSVLVSAAGDAEYDYAGLTPVLDPKRLVIDPTAPAGQKTYLVKYSEVTVQLAIELYTSSPEERSQCSMLLEDALNPVDWMYGFKLDLPHYFNQRAVYAPMTSQFLDSEDTAKRRWRPGTVMLSGQISVFRVRSLPTLDPRIDVVVDSPNP